MKIDYWKKGKVTFSMEDYIEKLLNEAPYDMEGTPAACHLFNTNDGVRKLSEEKVQLLTLLSKLSAQECVGKIGKMKGLNNN